MSLNRREILIGGLPIAAAGATGVALGVHAESQPTLTQRAHLPVAIFGERIFNSNLEVALFFEDKPFDRLSYGTDAEFSQIPTGFSLGKKGFVSAHGVFIGYYPGVYYGPIQYIAVGFGRRQEFRYEVNKKNSSHDQLVPYDPRIYVEESLPEELLTPVRFLKFYLVMLR